ncbi:MAG: hypothetical protein IKD46_08875, partial [Lentisphaeria bacterium]|nr:hypothetical protein [Lentisphaeria bacterium]
IVLKKRIFCRRVYDELILSEEKESKVAEGFCVPVPVPGKVCLEEIGKVYRVRLMNRAELSPDMPGVMQNPAGRCFPPYAGVTGLVTLSHSGLSADELESRWPFDEFGESAWESREALLDAMEMCRKDGFAVKRSAAGLTLAFFLGCGRTIGFCLKDPAEKAEPVLRTVKSLIAAMKF